MKNIVLWLFLLPFAIYAQQPSVIVSTVSAANEVKSEQKAMIEKVLDAWHGAASNAKFDEYFSYMSADAIFIGTDNTENWNIKQFKAFAKPYFEKGKAWNFTPVERHIYMTKELAWFDELLDTPNMKICRGSGVLRFENGQWKILHYVLSMTVPNDLADKVTQMKTKTDDQFVKDLKQKK